MQTHEHIPFIFKRIFRTHRENKREKNAFLISLFTFIQVWISFDNDVMNYIEYVIYPQINYDLV